MPETNGSGALTSAERERSREGQTVEGGPTPNDPKKHAAELLEQANRLMGIAYLMRREAFRLNAALGVPVRRRNKRSPSSHPPERSEEEFAVALGLRFAPEHTPSEMLNEAGSRVGVADDLQISDGARLMITNMATLGSSREDILTRMRNELGIENAEEILRELGL